MDGEALTDRVEEPAPRAKPGLSPEASRLIVTAILTIASVMQSLDSTIANVALPYMQGTMSASQEEISWVLTSYIVAAAITTALAGFLAAKFGRTRVFIICVTGFTVASALCGLSHSLSQIILFRILQGMFGAPMIPIAQAVLLDIYPVERRGQAMSVWTMGTQLGPIIGPIAGGYLTGSFSWSWVFYVNVPFGILAVIGAILFMRDTYRPMPIRLDWIGFATLSLAVGALQCMLDRGETKDWFSSPEIVTEAVLAGTGFYLFILQTCLAPKPFLPPALFLDSNYLAGLIVMFTITAVVYATMALLAPYLQLLMNYPVITAGLVMAPRGFATMMTMLVVGRLVGRMPARPMIALGLAISALSQYLTMQWTPDVSFSAIVYAGVLQGVAIGVIFVPLNVVAFASLPGDLRTEAAGVYSLARNIGSALGISVAEAFLTHNSQTNHAMIATAVTPFNRMLQTGGPHRFWDPAMQGGIAALNSEVTRQAGIIAYINDFRAIFIAAIMVAPVILLIRPPRSALRLDPAK